MAPAAAAARAISNQSRTSSSKPVQQQQLAGVVKRAGVAASHFPNHRKTKVNEFQHAPGGPADDEEGDGVMKCYAIWI